MGTRDHVGRTLLPGVYTHATCPQAKLSNLLFCLPYLPAAEKRQETMKSVLRRRCWWGPRGRWPAAFSESDGLTLNSPAPLICVTQEGHLPAAAWLNTGSLMDTFPPTLFSNRPAHSPPSPPDCLINQGLTLTLDKATF